jgi:protease-4
MRVNRLLSEIIRGEWLLNPEYLMGFAPVVQKIISGEELTFQPSTSALMRILDPQGNKVKPDEDGNVLVPEGAFAQVSMMGTVIKYGDFCTYGADEIVAALEKADKNPKIRGTIFVIDGPGGAVSAIGPFLQFAKTKKKPVIGLADACMSLHYWTAVAVCDQILADNDVSARFGSVGVVSSFSDAKPYWEAKGIKFHEIYPPESANKNESFRLALEGKYDKIIEEHLSPIAQKFQAAVRAGRPGLMEEKGVLNGKTYDADKAIGLGMIDGIGSMAMAMDQIRKLEFKQELKRII